MAKGGRFGKYGEQKRLTRLRQKQRSFIPPRGRTKFPKEKKNS